MARSASRYRSPARSKAVRLLRSLCALSLAGLLGGCNLVVMQPAGDVAVQQRNLVLASVGLMLLIIVPVIALTLLFAWRYRAANESAPYDPDWHHSTQLEVVIWTAPLLIIIALGALTWISTHTLDPFRPLRRLDATRPVAAGVKPLDRRGGRPRLEVAVLLSRLRDRHRQRACRARRSADRFQDHRLLGDERLLRPGVGRHDLRDAGHADAAPCGDQQAGRICRPVLAITAAAGFSRHDVQVPRPRRGRVRRLDRQGEGARDGPEPRGLPQAGEAQRGRTGQVLQVGRRRAVQHDRQHVRRAGQDVHERDDDHRRQGRSRQGLHREPRAPALRQPPHRAGRRAAGRHRAGRAACRAARYSRRA